jgi:xanthine dehydrogenase accessory factor
MKTWLEILEHCQSRSSSEPAPVLATLVEVQGSAYRQPGARMLLTGDGQHLGILSGGCLERDLLERIRQAGDLSGPMLVTYDTTSPADLIWGLGLGCNGVVRILVEPLNERLQPYLDVIASWLRSRQTGVIATVIEVDGSSRLHPGTRLLMDSTGTLWSDFPDGDLRERVIKDAQSTLESRCSFIQLYPLSQGTVRIFIEVIEPPTPLVLFGGGPDIQPLIRLAKELSWHVRVISPQALPELASKFALADVVQVVEPEQVAEALDLTSDTAVVIMTHNYAHDLTLLKTCLASPARYVGLLGPVKRREKMLQQIREEGFSYSPAQLTRLHNPAGLDLGAESPEGIALSIIAEIQAALSGRGGGFLKNRGGAIHAREKS